ncbi:hypothetical protein EKD04_017595 [Chloroflexales bacterium ZM16-3]|nr:hypothetical protein [Chloroflexales bacterium ZM16-3]
MDIARVTTDLDLMVEKLNSLRNQIDVEIKATRPTAANAEAIAKLRALETQLARARAGAITARAAAREIAPRNYQTEASGI